MENVNDMEIMLEGYEDMMEMGLLEAMSSNLTSSLISIAVYVFTALALYTIAKRRGINRPWLAWIPYANVWMLGCISDHYRAVAKGEVKYRRRWLLWTEIIVAVLAAFMMVLLFKMLYEMLIRCNGNLENMKYLLDSDLDAIMGPAVGMALIVMGMMVVAIVNAVFSFIALHDIYKSCDPGNATLFLILSIFIGYAQPILLFISRNKDEGMFTAQPVYYQPVFEQPVQPEAPAETPVEEPVEEPAEEPTEE